MNKGLKAYRRSMADLMIDMSLVDGALIGRIPADVGELNDVDGVEVADFGWNEAAAERLDVGAVNEGLASATLVLATAGLTVSQAEGLLKKLRVLLSEWSELRSAWIEMRDGHRVSVSDLTAEQLAEESAEA